MATDIEFIELVCARVAGAWDVRYKKMFGEYMVYINEKPLLLVCDNTVFVKMLPPLAEVMANAGRGIPYAGSKEHYILDTENIELCNKVIGILEPVTPLPKKRKK